MVLMAKLEKKNLHVPLNADLHGRLRVQAERSLRPATDLAREAIESWLRDQERAAVHAEIAAYAREQAGSSDDLDPALERAGLELLTGKKRRKK
jgi:hypothetical protein